MLERLEIYALGVVSLTAFVQLMNIPERMRIWLLAVQYLGSFILVSQSWSSTMAVAFLLAGWVGGAVLGMAMMGQFSERDALTRKKPGNRIPPMICLLSGIVILLISYSFGSNLEEWIPTIDTLLGIAAILLFGLGMIQMILRTDPVATTVGLLTVVTGFEILFTGLSSSIFVVGLLGGITLLICLIGAYWMLAEISLEGSP